MIGVFMKSRLNKFLESAVIFCTTLTVVFTMVLVFVQPSWSQESASDPDSFVPFSKNSPMGEHMLRGTGTIGFKDDQPGPSCGLISNTEITRSTAATPDNLGASKSGSSGAQAE